jgi:AraC-like DNA-binding protein
LAYDDEMLAPDDNAAQALPASGCSASIAAVGRGGVMKASGGATVSIYVLRAIVAAVTRCCVDVSAYLSDLGVTAEALASDDTRVRFSIIHDAWRLAEQRANDPLFGLHTAQTGKLGELDVLDYVCRSSKTLGECFAHAERYIRILHEGAEIRVSVAGREAQISYLPSSHPGGVLRQGAEYIIAGLLLRGRTFTGVQWSPREVWFQHPAPPDDAGHQKLFGCPIVFGRETNALVIDRALLDLPVPTADPGLNAVLSRHAEELLARLPTTNLLADQVRRLLPEALRKSDLQIESLAARLQLTPRSLQRRLREENTSFLLLLEETRRDLALRYVRERGMTVAELAFLLGFSDASTFVRAFKRWTGETPTDFRRAHAA